MTPDDLLTVYRSWDDLARRRATLLEALTRRFEAAVPSTVESTTRAAWLLGAVEQLVGLLSVPSRLAERARNIGETWPDPLTAPSFALEGRAWMGAAGECLPTWSTATEAAWRQAWLLLSDVLAAESLSPFSDGPGPRTDLRAPSARA
jgi:hypothetical protein